jgi:hypothetical protein
MAAAEAVIPVFGGAFANFLCSYFPATLKRREDAWLKELHRAFNDLQRHAVRIDDLSSNEEFYDLVCEATQVALRTRLEEKRAALRNAVVNAALPSSPSQVKQHMFLRLVADLTELHWLMLHLLADPAGWFRTRGKQLPVHRGATGIGFDRHASEARLEAVLAIAFPEHAKETALFQLVLDDLSRQGLIEDRTENRAMDMSTTCNPIRSFASRLGEEFLRFLREPPEPSNASS